jgi:hypothetical protein
MVMVIVAVVKEGEVVCPYLLLSSLTDTDTGADTDRP